MDNQRIIELTNELEEITQANTKRTSWKLRFILKSFKFAIIFFLIVSSSLVISQAWDMASAVVISQWTVLKLRAVDQFGLMRYNVKIVPMEEAELEDLLNTYAKKYHVRPIVAKAMIDQETTDTEFLSRSHRFRFEKSWKDAHARSHPKSAGMNEEEYNLIFSSIGLMQVSYVLWKDFCGLNTVNDLFNPATNIDCGLRIISRCLEDNLMKHSKNSSALRYCFRTYNGSGPDAERYAEKMMSRVTDMVVDRESLLEDKPSRNTLVEKAETNPLALAFVTKE
jgi:soluble lytic murein transglycosylase-like protein